MIETIALIFVVLFFLGLGMYATLIDIDWGGVRVSFNELRRTLVEDSLRNRE